MLKWAGGILASIISAVAIYWLTQGWPWPWDDPAPAAYEFRIRGVDDAITCELNGKPIGSATFSQPNLEKDVTDLVQPGDNRLRCEVSDDQNGECYSYNL